MRKMKDEGRMKRNMINRKRETKRHRIGKDTERIPERKWQDAE